MDQNQTWFSSLYAACSLCPRNCGINRNKGATGFCGESNIPRVAYAGLHNGEEPPISGEKGSGTVFFTGCTLQCFFCQNYQISKEKVGTPVSPEELAGIFLRLQDAGAANINLVSGTHFAPGIITAVATAKQLGLTLPIVWNSSGFDKITTLKLLADTVDIWLPDLKTLDPGLAQQVFGRADYPGCAEKGLLYLAGHTATPQKNLIVRHLVLPGAPDATCAVLSWFRDKLIQKSLLSLMFQYTPPEPVKKSGCFPAPFLRPLLQEEYDVVCTCLESLDIGEGFIQELDAEEQSWSPDFTRQNPFPSSSSKPVWHNGHFVD